MKVLLYFQNPEAIKKSGIGRALKHQCEALDSQGIEYTFDPKDDFDIAHINTYWPKSKQVLKSIRKRHIPVIMHGHSTIEDFKNSFRFWKAIARVWYNPNLMWFYKNADYIITPTKYSKKCIDAYNLGTPVTHVSNGIDINEYKYNEEDLIAFKNKFNITNQRVVIGVGWFFNRKGIKDFFEIARNRPDVTFIWFGSLNKFITTRDVLKAIKNRPSNVIMPGYIDSSIIRGAYHYASCLLFPTYEETEGIVILEALASHCPVLVRDIEVYSDWLKDGQDCYKAKSNDEFLTKLDYILSHNNNKIINNGYQIAESLSLQNVGKELKQIYEKVIKDYKEGAL